MTLEEYAAHDAVALAELIRTGALEARAAIDLALVACEAAAPLGAVVERYDDAGSRHEPPSAPRARTPGPGGLAGVPFLMKDAGAAEPGRRQERGSRLLRGVVPRAPSPLWSRFSAAGLVSVGRSAAPEFSLAGCTHSALHGPTRNPWDPRLSAGGSSGGAAAAVAAGVVPVAHATDAAGSIRWPASACGLVGLKPSRAHAPHASPVDEPLLGMDTEFALTRTVRDAAALFDLVASTAPADLSPAPGLAVPAATAIRLPCRPLRIAVATHPPNGAPVEDGVVSATERTAATLAELGHQVTDARPELDYDAFVDAAVTGWALGFDREVDAFARSLGRDPSTHLEPVGLSLLERARSLSDSDVVRAVREIACVRRGVAAFFESHDALLTPTLVRPPEPLGTYAAERRHPSFEAYFRHCDRTGAWLPPCNMAGVPAISLPIAWSEEGLPLGMQLVAAWGRETTLLQLAAQLEEAHPWRSRRPAWHLTAPAASRPEVTA